jgi:hypothetical protein
MSEQNQLKSNLVPVWYGLLAVVIFSIIVALIYFNKYYFLMFISVLTFIYAIIIVVTLWRHPGCFSSGIYKTMLYYSVFTMLIEILVAIVVIMMMFKKN